MAIRTFVDADVLIWAARGQEPLSPAALAVLTSPDREFVASDFLELEVLPKAAYNRQIAEEAFYRRFFAAVVARAPVSPQLMALARADAIRYGRSAGRPSRGRRSSDECSRADYCRTSNLASIPCRGDANYFHPAVF